MSCRSKKIMTLLVIVLVVSMCAIGCGKKKGNETSKDVEGSEGLVIIDGDDATDEDSEDVIDFSELVEEEGSSDEKDDSKKDSDKKDSKNNDSNKDKDKTDNKQDSDDKDVDDNKDSDKDSDKDLGKEDNDKEDNNKEDENVDKDEAKWWGKFF